MGTKTKYGSDWNFAQMIVTSTVWSGTYTQRLEVRNGLIGWIGTDGVWYKGWTRVQEDYNRWLDMQIYGE